MKIPYSELERRIVSELSAFTDFAEREARLILEELTGLDRFGVMFDEVGADEETVHRVEEILTKRRQRIPLQYILGKAYFRNLELYVDERVLIPRPETEILVDFALEEIARIRQEKIRRYPDAPESYVVRVLDIGTGSGAIAAAIADETGEAVINAGADAVRIDAVDISADALECARRNLAPYSNVGVFESDLFSAVRGTYDVICSNPPYIGSDERADLAEEVLKEPHTALFAEECGLGVYRCILEGIEAHMNDCTSVILEIGAKQYEAVRNLFAEITGRTDVEPILDYSGRRRFICMKNSK